MAIPVNNRYPNSRELFEPVYPESDCYLESEKIARYTLEQERQMSLDDRELPTVLERWSQEAVDIGVEIDQERLMVKWVEEDTVLV
ncbi:MAG: hypothetical protein KDD60_11145, partial [Bdellovibrionales bacterium]|nr:hypothetical protein [Bdellovibrionales bacterium]